MASAKQDAQEFDVKTLPVKTRDVNPCPCPCP